MKATKKGISDLLKRKNKAEEETPKDIAPPPPEPEFSQIPEISSNPENITCPNNRCRRIFNKPLELIDLAKPSEQGSYVCPHCLTKLEPTQPELGQEAVQETFPETLQDEKIQDVVEPKEGTCPQFVGYLGKRPKNAPIPDFCLTCPQMMKCMSG